REIRQQFVERFTIQNDGERVILRRVDENRGSLYVLLDRVKKNYKISPGKLVAGQYEYDLFVLVCRRGIPLDYKLFRPASRECILCCFFRRRRVEKKSGPLSENMASKVRYWQASFQGKDKKMGYRCQSAGREVAKRRGTSEQRKGNLFG